VSGTFSREIYICILTIIQTQQPSNESTLVRTGWVYIRERYGKIICIINITRKDAIALMKRNIEARAGHRAENQRLIFAERHLENYRTVADYNIIDGNTLYLFVVMQLPQIHPKIHPIETSRSGSPADNDKFKVCILGAVEVIIDVTASDTCRMLKERIHKATTIPIDQQILNLIRTYTVMDSDYQTLGFYQITSGDMILVRDINPFSP
jgi:hypothetical protein